MTTATRVIQQNVHARETARRRPAYAAIDAAYYAGAISEAAKNLAKWQLRVLCGIRTFFDTTQSQQAQQFICPRNQRHLSRRHIIRLNQELEAANLIWREARGTGYRSYITAYEPKPPQQLEGSDANVAEQLTEAYKPTYAELRQAIDQALAVGQVGRAAMLEYQAAMLLARHSSVEIPGASQQGTAPTSGLFFDPTKGDNGDTNSVTTTSPNSLIKYSGIPKGDTKSSVCTGDDGTNVQQQSNQTAPDIPDTAATRLLTKLGVEDPSALIEFSAAPLDRIYRAEQRRAELGYTAGMIVRILRDGGKVWRYSGKRQQEDTPHERCYSASCPHCGKESPYILLDDTFCPACHWQPRKDEHETQAKQEVIRVPTAMHALWQDILNRIDTDQASLDTWLKPAVLIAHEDNCLILHVPNIFVRQEIEDAFLGDIRRHATDLLGASVEIVTVVGTTLPGGSGA